MALIIGLTGSIASGKSTISLMFDDIHINVIDADKIAREVVYPNNKAYDDIVDYFGEEILREDQTIDRKALGQIVFHDQKKLDVLNGFVHPRIRERMIEKRDLLIEKGEHVIVLDIPLLFENNLDVLVDRTIVVYVKEETQIERLKNREQFTREEAINRIQLQMPLEEKKLRADAVIDNNGSKYDSFKQLQDILKSWSIN